MFCAAVGSTHLYQLISCPAKTPLGNLVLLSGFMPYFFLLEGSVVYTIVINCPHHELHHELGLLPSSPAFCLAVLSVEGSAQHQELLGAGALTRLSFPGAEMT